MKRAVIPLIVGVGALLAGCVAQPRDGLPRVRYGERACDECRMLVSDERFAAALIDRDGEQRVFDGIGCLVRYLAVHPGATRLWVHDYDSKQECDARQMSFVHVQELDTPMGDGLAAFTTRVQAEAFAAAHHGDVISFGQLTQVVTAPNVARRP